MTINVSSGILTINVTAPAAPAPAALVGFGAGVTGGSGGEFVRVTSLDDGSGVGTIRWALDQNLGSPVYIALCVEGEIALGSVLNITRPDVTIDGRFAPGAGCWFVGERIEVERSNIFLDHIVHLGNDPTFSANSDCIRFGDFLGVNDVDGVYVRNGEWRYGRDECFSLTPRQNGESTGPRVLNMTAENNVLGYPTGVSHELITLIGDGSERVTFTNNLFTTAAGRYPLCKQFSSLIEWINNALYNFNQNCVQIASDAQFDFVGNNLRLGPHWGDIRGPISLDADNDVYVADALVDSPTGLTNSWGLYQTANTPNRVSRFTPTSGLVPVSSALVEQAISDRCGPRLYGGVRHAHTQEAIDEYLTGAGQADLETYPGGPVRTATGASYPEANVNGVPLTYLDSYPADTDPAAVIADGSAWNGKMVAERIGAWHVAP